MGVTAKLFMSGRSQAIRLPAKFRLDAGEVLIERVGGALWVQPKAAPGQTMAEWLAGFYQSSDALPDDFLVDRKDNPPQTRDWA